MSRAADRPLTRAEIDIVVHLLRVGGATMPVSLLSGARELAGGLCRLGLLHIWHRQNIQRGRPEGPFYTLTRDGALRAESLMLRRAERQATEDRINRRLREGEYTPPPPRELNEETDNARS